MSTPPVPLRDSLPSRPQPITSFAFAKPRRRSRVLPWLLLALVWGAVTALLVLGTEAAPLVAALAG